MNPEIDARLKEMLSIEERLEHLRRELAALLLAPGVVTPAACTSLVVAERGIIAWLKRLRHKIRTTGWYR
jgi:hypothetical protein